MSHHKLTEKEAEFAARVYKNHFGPCVALPVPGQTGNWHIYTDQTRSTDVTDDAVLLAAT